MLEADVPSDRGRDEELRAIGVFTRIGHAQHAGLAVLELEVLIGKFGPVDGFPPGSYPNMSALASFHDLRALPALTITFGEIASLDHELPDHPMEC